MGSTAESTSSSTTAPTTKALVEQALEAIKALQAQVQALLNQVNSKRRRKRESEKESEIHHRSQRAVNVDIVDLIITLVKKWSFNGKYYNSTEGISKISEYTEQIKTIKSEVVSG